MDGRSPNHERQSDRLHIIRAGSRAAVGLFVLALLYTAYFTRAILVPIVIAILFMFLLTPVVRILHNRLRLPRPLAALLAVMALGSALGFATSLLSAPAVEWMTKLPVEAGLINGKVQRLLGPVLEMKDAAERMENMAQGNSESGMTSGASEPLAVVVRGPSLVSLVFGQTMAISLGILVTAVLLLFLLSSGDNLLRHAISVTPKLRNKVRVVEIARETEAELSHYVLSISLINAGLGLAVGIAMSVLGMPNPALWGVMAGLFNFIPFVGPLIATSVMGLVALVTFDAPLDILMPPLIYLGLHGIESQFITPLIVARRLILNPIAILLAVILWTWLWGVPGGLLAVPMLAVLKIICDHVEMLNGVGILLGRLDAPVTPPKRVVAATPIDHERS